MASYSRHYSRHLIATLLVMIVSVSGLTATLCSAFSSIAPSSLDPLASSLLGLSLAGIVCLIVCVWAIIRLWHLVRLPLHQTTFFVGAMENRDTTARLPRSSARRER